MLKGGQAKIKINYSSPPSRFLVKLPSDFGLESKKEINTGPKKFKKEKILLGKLNFTVKHLKKYFGGLKKKIYQGRLKRLVLVQIGYTLFFIIYKILQIIYSLSWRVGWLTMFWLRFFVFFFLKLISLLTKIGNFLKNKKKKLFNSLEFQPIHKSLTKEANFFSASFSRAYPTEETIFSLPPIKDRSVSAFFSYCRFHYFLTVLKPRPKKVFLRSAFSLSLIFLVLILPLKALTYYNKVQDLRGRVLGVSEAAVADLGAGAAAVADFNFQEAGDNFQAAAYNFNEIRRQINQIKNWLAALAPFLPSKKIKLAANAAPLAEAGYLSAELGQEMTKFLNQLSSSSPTEIIPILEEQTMIIGRQIKELAMAVSRVDAEALPPEYKSTFLALKEKTALLADNFSAFERFLALSKIFLGFDQTKRYLLIFQNNAELRASGGFVGSFALLDLDRGQIKNLEVPAGGSYDTEAGLYDLIAAPEPLQLVRARWYFWDANWWPDWPTSARKLAWFYEHSGGSSVDGVISLTPTVIERLLKIIGPIDMTAEYGVVIEADNFWPVVQSFAEQKPPITRQPKKIIGDLLEKIIDELPARLNRRLVAGLLQTIDTCLAEKHILFYFSNPRLEKAVADYGWDGKIKDTRWDYLMVTNTNIAGAKTDRVIKEEINLDTKISPDGAVINQLWITRRHTGRKGEEFVGVRNVDWLRVYVPAGSKLLEAAGFVPPPEKYFKRPDAYLEIDPDIAASEGQAKTHWPSGVKIYREFNKTVFAGWAQVDPGQTITLYLKYKLPFQVKIKKETDDYQSQLINFFNPTAKPLIPYALLVQKQPGTIGSDFFAKLTLPASWRIVDYYPQKPFTNINSWQINTNLTTDKFWAIVLSLN